MPGSEAISEADRGAEQSMIARSQRAALGFASPHRAHSR
jgi:hypothetical protein